MLRVRSVAVLAPGEGKHPRQMVRVALAQPPRHGDMLGTQLCSPGGFVSLCEICEILPQVCKLERCLQPHGTC